MRLRPPIQKGFSCIQLQINRFKISRTLRPVVTKELSLMKNILWLTAGFCAAAAGIILWGPRRTQPLPELAHRLQEAWADNHTVV